MTETQGQAAPVLGYDKPKRKQAMKKVWVCYKPGISCPVVCGTRQLAVDIFSAWEEELRLLGYKFAVSRSSNGRIMNTYKNAEGCATTLCMAQTPVA